MTKPKFHTTSRGNYIRGEFNQPIDPNGEIISKSPADFSDVLGKFRYSYHSVDDAVQSAKEAFVSWRKTTLAERAAFLKKYQAALKAREDEIVEAIAREVGKPLWESKTELSAMIGKIDITINESMK